MYTPDTSCYQLSALLLHVAFFSLLYYERTKSELELCFFSLSV